MAPGMSTTPSGQAWRMAFAIWSGNKFFEGRFFVMADSQLPGSPGMNTFAITTRVPSSAQGPRPPNAFHRNLACSPETFTTLLRFSKCAPGPCAILRAASYSRMKPAAVDFFATPLDSSSGEIRFHGLTPVALH